MKSSMTQDVQIAKYVLEYGEIVPARMSGKVYKGRMFGSEATRECRRMRERGLLNSERWEEDTKFVVFYPTKKLEKIYKN